MTQLHVPYMLGKMVYSTSQDGNNSDTLLQIKISSHIWYSTAPKHKYGYEIPRTYEQAKRHHQRNGNTLWGDATVL
jgi:hypothetical protein